MNAITVDLKRGNEFEGMQKRVYERWGKLKGKYQN